MAKWTKMDKVKFVMCNSGLNNNFDDLSEMNLSGK